MCWHRFLSIPGVCFAVWGLLPASVSAQYVQQSKLVTNNSSQAGWSVALSEIGNFALFGDPTAGRNTSGAAVVFKRSGAVWNQEQVFELFRQDKNDNFGWSVALSDPHLPPIKDLSKLALVGIPGYGGFGGAEAFAREVATLPFRPPWRGFGGVFLAPERRPPPAFGTSVSMSEDGTTAIIGGPDAGDGTGAAWIFVRLESHFTQQGAKLVGTSAGGAAKQGSAVAISGDGKTVLIGGPDDTGGAGAVWVFAGTNGRWRQQGTKLFGTGAVGNARQGAAVALSFDGNTALVGGPADDGGVGAVWVFTRANDGSWSQQGPKLVGNNSLGAASQGTSVALDDDGNTAVIGGPGDNNKDGAAWVFTRLGGQWNQLGDLLSGSNASSMAQQGFSVALSRDGNYLIFGGPRNIGGGAAWVFTRFTGTPGATSCRSDSVATLNANYSNNLDNAAMALGFAKAEDLVSAVMAYCQS